MILVKPSFEILTKLEHGKGRNYVRDLMVRIEQAGRTCYKSEDKITADSANKFVAGIIASGHHSVIEHENISVRIICDRGVTHEIVRHRLCAYSQESTRYCNYKGGVTFVIPPWMDLEEGEWDQVGEITIPIKKGLKTSEVIMLYDVPSYQQWLGVMIKCERSYRRLLKNGWTPQQARSVLPNSLKTEIVMTANIREWRHILGLRTSKAAHPQMREIMIPILEEFSSLMPVLFAAL